MNRENAKELLPIIQAFAEGKIIQKKQYAYLKWDEVIISERNEFDFSANPKCYRIKPEPEIIYANKIKGVSTCIESYKYEEDAILVAKETAGGDDDYFEYIAKEFMEVIK